MNIARKLQLAQQAINNIATHFDEDSQVLHAALDRVGKMVVDAKTNLAAKLESDFNASVERINAQPKTAAQAELQVLHPGDSGRLEDFTPKQEG
jgi:ABC-type hemin transport system substrate-binding protein